MTEEKHEEPEQENTVVISVFLFIFMAGIIVTNGSVTGILVSRRRLVKPQNMYIVALCASQLLVGTFVIFSAVIGLHIIDANLVWCAVAPFTELIAFTACIFSLLGISVDRYRSVMYALTYKPTKQRSLFTILFIMISAVIYSLRAFVQFVITKESAGDGNENSNETTNMDEYTFCNLLTEDSAADIWFRIFDFCMLFILPSMIMAYLYSKIIYKLWAKNMVSTGSTKKKRKAVILSVVCVTTFLLCWLPYYIIEIVHDSFVTAIGEDKLGYWYHTVRYVAVFIALSNSIINPIIYGFLNKNFQKELTLIKTRYFCKRNRVQDRIETVQPLSSINAYYQDRPCMSFKTLQRPTDRQDNSLMTFCV